MDAFKESYGHVKEFVEGHMVATSAFAAIGAVYSGVKMAQALRSCYKYLIRPSRDLKKRYGDGWAIVTGANDGIGKGLAFELAKRGFKVGLFGRDKEKLDAVAAEIQATHHVETKVGVFDFDVFYTEEKVQELQDLFDQFDKVSIFVCCAGMVEYDYFHQYSIKQITQQLHVNVFGTTMCARLIIPKLLKNERSALYFVGSSSFLNPGVEWSVYTGAKSYVYSLARSLVKEYSDKIDVMFSTTWSVKTKGNQGYYLFTITPEESAKQTLDKLGHDTLTNGHYKHALGNYIASTVLIGRIYRYINYRREVAAGESE